MKKILSNGTTTAAQPGAPASQLKVVVPYTTPGLTRSAMRYAAALGEELQANVLLIDAHVVPFPVPVNEPTVHREFLEERLRTAAEETTLPNGVQLVFTRDRVEAFRRILEPGSLVVIATRGWWWFSAERKLARLLSKAGHDVVVLAGGSSGKSAVRRFSRLTTHLVR